MPLRARKEESKIRCICCNKKLSDYEATRRHSITKQFLDTCSECLSVIMGVSYVPHTDRLDLLDEDHKDSTDFEEPLDVEDKLCYP